jgi:CheY-like chemotaxis protein
LATRREGRICCAASQVYGFPKQSGGHAKIYSEQGEGTTVKMYLPRVKEEDPTIRLLFTDVGLPGLNGRQVADKAWRLRPDVRVVFASGYAHHALVHQGRLDPDVELLAKPFTFNDLAAKIRRALDAPDRT